jgi:hypothetical protein
MHEIEANVTLEDEWQPVELYHVAQGLRWTVLEVLDGWTHPGWPGKTYQKPIVEKWYRLCVFGPLPGRPYQLGEFVMIVTSYGNRDRWWIRPETQTHEIVMGNVNVTSQVSLGVAGAEAMFIRYSWNSLTSE